MPPNPSDVAIPSRRRTSGRESLDRTALFETLEHWRRRAALQSDRADFTRVARGRPSYAPPHPHRPTNPWP